MKQNNTSLDSSTFDPFRRDDRYGTSGMKPQPYSEKILLGALSLLVLPLKVIGALSCLVAFYSFCRLSLLIPKSHRADAVAAVGKLACRCCLFSLGFCEVKWEKPSSIVKNKIPAAEPCVIVSNHCSWIDILVHMSRFFPAFVARDGTKNMVLIGLIRCRKISTKKHKCFPLPSRQFCKAQAVSSYPYNITGSKNMGCVFVDRERKDSSTQVVKERISSASTGANTQRPMLLFPEGTTTNGKFLLPFKSGAFLAGCPVQPVILKYKQGRVSPAWESIPALKHIWLILCIPFHSVTATELPVYFPSTEEKEQPLLFANNVRKYMLQQGNLRTSEATLADKREFHSRLLCGGEGSNKKVL